MNFYVAQRSLGTQTSIVDTKHARPGQPHKRAQPHADHSLVMSSKPIPSQTYGRKKIQAPWQIGLSVLAASGVVRAQGSIDPAKSVHINRFLSAAGTGTAADVTLVAGQLSQLPLSLLARVANDTTFKMVACKNNVTDWDVSHTYFNVSAHPRGYGNLTYADAQGLFLPVLNTVIIAATQTDGTVLTRSAMPGSASAPLHELGHYIDSQWGSYDRYGRYSEVSSSATFMLARSKDAARLEPYFVQSGVAGRQETFAEYFGQSFNNASFRDPAPNVFNYFSGYLCNFEYPMTFGNETAGTPATCTPLNTAVPTSTPTIIPAVSTRMRSSTITSRSLPSSTPTVATSAARPQTQPPAFWSLLSILIGRNQN